jgi:hypothetical protein
MLQAAAAGSLVVLLRGRHDKRTHVRVLLCGSAPCAGQEDICSDGVVGRQGGWQALHAEARRPDAQSNLVYAVVLGIHAYLMYGSESHMLPVPLLSNHLPPCESVCRHHPQAVQQRQPWASDSYSSRCRNTASCPRCCRNEWYGLIKTTGCGVDAAVVGSSSSSSSPVRHMWLLSHRTSQSDHARASWSNVSICLGL